MTSSSQPITTHSPPQPPPAPPQVPPQRNFRQRVWDRTTSAIGGAVQPIVWGGRAVATGVQKAGEGIGSVTAKGARKEIEKMVQPDGPFVGNLQASVLKALLNQPPEELLVLKELIKAVLEDSDSLTPEETQTIDSYFKLLFKQDAHLLKQLAPDLSPEDFKLFKTIADLFKDPAKITLFEKDMQSLKDFDTVFTKILDKNHGALVHTMAFLHEALLEDENGMLGQAIDVLKKKCTDENTGLMKEVIDQLTVLLGKKDGPIDLLTTKLTVGEESTIARAVNLIKGKMLDKDGLVDQIGKRFNDEEEGIIVKALAIAKTKMDELLANSLAKFKEELTKDDGLMTTLREQLSTGDKSVLKEAIALLKESLFKPDEGIVAKLRRELTSEENGMLHEALKIFAKSLNDEKEGILTKTMELLKGKLNADDGPLSEALRLIELKLNGKDGVVEKLQHRLLNENDGALIKALHLLQDKLNNEKDGILAKSIQLLETRLFDEQNGTLAAVEKRLTAEDTGILTKAVDALKKALEKKDGTLDLMNVRFQKMLEESLELLKKKCLDEKDGLITQALENLNKQLKAENGLFETLNQRLNDPKDGILVKAVATLNTKLTEKDGTLDLLQKRLLDEKDGIVVKAIDLLNSKLQQKDGPLDTLQKKINDKDGIIDKAMNQLQERLTHEEHGILTQVKQYLMDEKKGILAEANELLKKKLKEEGGVLDIIEHRLNDKEEGILIKAARILQDKLVGKGGVLDQVDEKLTGRAHPLLSNSRKKLIQLQKGIANGDKAAITKSSRELQQLLENLNAQTATVFTKQALTAEDQLLLNQFKDKLPGFYAENPPSQGDMLLAAEAGLSVLERYYSSQEGIAARTGAIFQESLTGAVESMKDAVDPVLSRLENLPITMGKNVKTMVDNLMGRTPSTDSPAAEQGAAGEGTISQFLENGGSILKNILQKGAQAVSQQALASFASILILGIKEVLKKMDSPAGQDPLNNRDPYQTCRTALEGVVASLDSARENGGWQDLYQNLINAAQAMRTVKIYVQGFRLPNAGSNGNQIGKAEGIYSNNIHSLQNAMDNAPEQPGNQEDWKKLANEEKDKLITNTARFLTIKHIYENVCSLKPADEQFYLTLMKKAKEKPRADSELKKLFFEELDKNKVNFATRLFAQVQYFIYNRIVKHYTKKGTTVYFDEVFNYIDEHKKNQFTSLRSQVTKNFTRYLTILGGAYENVANDPKPSGTLQEMLKKQLDTKESNMGFDTKELYLEFAHNVIYKTIGGGLAGWIAKKLIRDPEQIVHDIIDKTIGSMQDTRGYMHAMNSVIRDQLEEVLKLLRKSLAVTQPNSSPAGAAGQTAAQTTAVTTQPGEEEFDINMKELSETEKNDLNALVKNLFEILRKSKCQTKDELRELIKERLLSAKINRAIDDLFIEDIIEKVTNILVATARSFAQRQQLQKLTYKFANLVNRSFELGETVTLKEMQEEEHAISKLSSQILRLTVNKAVSDKFDFTGEVQQVETNRSIQDLHERSQEFFTTTGQDLHALAQMDFASREGKIKINKIIEETLAYESQCHDTIFQAKSSKTSSDNKNELGERHLKIAEHSAPVVQAVSQLKQHLTRLEHIQTVVPHLQQIQTIVAGIPLRLFPTGTHFPSHDELIHCENQFAILNTHLQDLKKMRHFAQIAEQIAAETRTIETLLVEIKKNAKMCSFCMGQSQHSSQIEEIAAERKHALGVLSAQSPLHHKIEMFKQEIVTRFDDVYRPQLLIKLKNIEEASIDQQVDLAVQEFLSICRQAMTQATTSIDAHRRSYFISYQRMEAAIRTTHLLEPNQQEAEKAGIRASIGLAQQRLQALSQWEATNIRAVPYISYNLVDTKGMQDWASNIVYDRVQEKLNGFMGFLKQEETYRYGLLNHLFLVPYLAPGKKS